ncbi:MAG: hypothetical protein WDN67_03795 [Candidatus Moraniibacteriota bacterium]
MRISHLSSKRRASILVFTLIILSFLLVSSLSVATVALTQTRTTNALNRSSLAFQAADAGIEAMFRKLYGPTGAQGVCSGVSPRFSCMTASDGTSPSFSCTSTGRIRRNVATTQPTGTYEITLYDDSGDVMECNEINPNSTTWRRDLERITSEGTFGGTTRAVQAEIKYVGP